jgi:hypothetical protein
MSGLSPHAALSMLLGADADSLPIDVRLDLGELLVAAPEHWMYVKRLADGVIAALTDDEPVRDPADPTNDR